MRSAPRSREKSNEEGGGGARNVAEPEEASAGKDASISVVDAGLLAELKGIVGSLVAVPSERRWMNRAQAAEYVGGHGAQLRLVGDRAVLAGDSLDAFLLRLRARVRG